MRRIRITRALAAALALVAFGAPAAVAQQDLRSPDTRDAAAVAQAGQDLRSPDARDAAAGRGTFSAPEVAVVKLEQPAPAAPESGGLDWSAAVIGAGTVVGLMLIALGTVALVQRRHSAQTA